ncbi:helix-turn-helix domain-containing protein [Streptomyces viridosporus]|uniref:helix-turn-helix domain-containing protein n=1 Tax=Streptomyces viridosporus TaxID=67581 RepID=UPI003D9F947E
MGNHLAQHRELSLTAIGLATHMLSVPEGTPVDIRSLAERFPEGRDRIAFALRELEANGYLERVREHTEAGRLVTRTYLHHTPLPGRAAASSVPAPVRAAGRAAVNRARSRTRDSAAGTGTGDTLQEDDQAPGEPVVPVLPVAPVLPSASVAPVTPPASVTPVTPSASVAPAFPVAPDMPVDVSDTPVPVVPSRDSVRSGRWHEEAVTLLAGLRRADERLTLSLRDVNRLAPSVVEWLERGVTSAAVHRTLTADLPVVMKHPAGVIAYRLRALLPPPLPAAPAPSPSTAAHTGGTAHRPHRHPFQDCDGCERVFRAPEPGRCRDCRTGPTAAGEGGACAA